METTIADAVTATASTTSRPTSFQLDEFYLDLLENGSIRLRSNKEIRERPFPGLRPFKTSEFQLFRGRDGQAETLVNRLKRNHFLAVIGSSGTGKSSLIRAGLIPHLLGGYFPEAGRRWDIAICRPGHDPLENLSIALARVKSRSNDKEKILAAYDEITSEINDNIYGILEVNELLHPSKKQANEKTNLLIIVDQFEELFRFNRDDLKNPGIENHFVNLLLKASADSNSSIYVIITMRSEFLGDSVKYRGLPEAINEGQFLVPQLTRKELREVIEGPIKLAGKKIDSGLVEMLINEVEQSKLKKDLDQLPILQHTLMRTFEEAAKDAQANEITDVHYQACGGMEKALANHAEAKYKGLGKGKNGESFEQKIAKLVFQALTDTSADQKGGRRPTELETIHAIAKSIHANPEEVDAVINQFRDTETSFIMPPINTPLYPELIMDISHESLMRQWQRLRDWTGEEAEAAQKLTSLMQAQRLYKKGEKDLLEGKELYPISHWFKAFNPQPAWAERYDKNYQEGFDYLRKSEKVSRQKTTGISIVSVLGLLAVIVGYLYWSETRQKERMRTEQQRQTQREVYLLQRQGALENQDSLLAALCLAEALQFGNEEDTLLNESTQFLPVYFLQHFFEPTSDVDAVAFSKNADSLYLWNKNNVCYRFSTLKGSLIDSGVFNSLVPPPEQPRDTVVHAIKTLYSQWNVKPDGTGPILNEDLSLNVKVPRNAGPINRGVRSPDGQLFLSFGQYRNDTTYGASLWNLNDGHQVSTTLLHPQEIEDGIFSHDNRRIAMWDGYKFRYQVKLYKRLDLDRKSSDKDIPANLFRLQMQVATGAKLNAQQKTVQSLSLNEWAALYKQWQQQAATHFKNCNYPQANYWHMCSLEDGSK
jgi:energy-coupling factor transporter ATP-binding protein EcfA2